MPRGAALQVEVLERRLRTEGFLHTYIWQDGPGAYYAEHTHECATAHIVLEGELTLGQGGEQRTYGIGERCDIPADSVHWARMGPAGCRYLIGER